MNDDAIMSASDRSVPVGYERPDVDDSGTVYYLSEQEQWTGATPLFMVIKRQPGGQRIIAEKCYRWAGMEIVDALRNAESPT